MHWVSAVSDEDSFDRAVSSCVARLRRELGEEEPDLAVAFVSPGYGPPSHRLHARLADLGARHVVGCSAGGVIGGGQEIEAMPALSLTAALLPDVEVTPFHLESGAGSSATVEVGAAAPAASDAHFIVLADPFSFDSERFVRQMDVRFPGGRVVGGLASGGNQPGVNALYLDGEVHGSGAVGVGLTGAIEVDILVAQGCRPIGAPMFVTACRQNIIEQLDGQRPYDVLTELYQNLPRRDQDLFRHSLFLGIVMRSSQQQYRQGDFLIRNILGLDRDGGSLAIGALCEERSVVQFHLRDAQTSSEDLDAVLARYRSGGAAAGPAGALMFSCLGRGQHLYGTPDHDTNLVQRHLGPLPMGGFFCNGEIGPVNGQTYLHGYTSSIGVFRGRARA
jgi:small ligand-binding sensory domain FIST